MVFTARTFLNSCHVTFLKNQNYIMICSWCFFSFVKLRKLTCSTHYSKLLLAAFARMQHALCLILHSSNLDGDASPCVGLGAADSGWLPFTNSIGRFESKQLTIRLIHEGWQYECCDCTFEVTSVSTVKSIRLSSPVSTAAQILTEYIRSVIDFCLKILRKKATQSDLL